MKKLILSAFLIGSIQLVSAQKILSEGIITYSITVVSAGDQPAVAEAFAGASQTSYIKGYKGRIDFISPLRRQSSVYDAQNADGFIMKQSGNEKYLIPLEDKKWTDYHKKYQGLAYTITSETRQVLGYTCKKAIGKLADGTELTVFFTSDLTVMAKGYEPAFASLDGLILEYDVKSGGVVLNYKATKVQMTMVSAGTFEMPTSGYKVLQYQTQ